MSRGVVGDERSDPDPELDDEGRFEGIGVEAEVERVEFAGVTIEFMDFSDLLNLMISFLVKPLEKEHFRFFVVQAEQGLNCK